MEVYKIIRTNEKVWGKEEVFADEPGYCGKVMTLEHGFRCSIHKHLKKDETFHVLDGMMQLEIYGSDGSKLTQIHILANGDSFRIPPGIFHSFLGLDDCRFIEVSTHDSPEDNVRVSQSCRAA